MTQAHGLGLLTLQDHPQDKKRLLHDAIQAGWSGAEVTIQAKERLRDIDTRRGQTTIEGTEEAAKTKAEPKRESSGSSSGASGGGSSPSGARLSLVPSTAPADSTTGQTSDAAPETTSDASTNSELLEAAEPESRNDSLAKKARSFIEAAFNELGQIDADGYDLEDIGWAQEHLKRALGSLKLAKNELSAAN